jgi:hypothetical protein
MWLVGMSEWMGGGWRVMGDCVRRSVSEGGWST